MRWSSFLCRSGVVLNYKLGIFKKEVSGINVSRVSRYDGEFLSE